MEETEHKQEPTVLTVQEACRALRVSKWSLYRLMNTHQLRYIHVGRRRLIPAAAVDAFIQTRLREDIA